MTDDEMRDWIDRASYAQRLRKWRFEPLGSPWFVGAMGAYFDAAFKKARATTPQEEQVNASKSLGWED